MSFVSVIPGVFISAMAVFGFWCLFGFVWIDISLKKHFRFAIDISGALGAEEIEKMLEYMDMAKLVPKHGKYALLISSENDIPPSLPDLPKDLLERAELYVKTEIKEKE